MVILTVKNIFKYFFILILIFNQNDSYGQNKDAFRAGEWLKYKISYSGWFKAGEATVNLSHTNNQLHAKMIGKSTGPINLFFKVYDRYESYFDKEKHIPIKFIRDINEGGYTKNLEILFNHELNEAKVNDFKRKSSKIFPIVQNSQDMVSVFYFLRNYYELNTSEDNNDFTIDMFFDSENYKLKIRYLSTEIINTNFGKVLCYKIQPYVQSGRVFKKNESLTMWITADMNRIPIRIKADLIVGSVRVDLESFSNLNNPFEIKFD